MEKLHRHSSRIFSEKQIDKDLLNEILTEALEATPSWENSQPWKLYVATGDSLRKIQTQHLDHSKNGDKSWTDIVPPAEWGEQEQRNINRWESQLVTDLGDTATSELGDSNKNLFYSKAIVYLAINEKGTMFSAYDVGALGEEILNSATKRGIGSVPAYEFIRYPSDIRKAFKIADEYKVFMGIGLGYPTEDRINDFNPKRLDLNDMVEFIN